MPFLALFWMVIGFQEGDVRLLTVTSCVFVVMFALNIQLRLTTPVAVERRTLTLRLGRSDVDIDAADIAWVFRSAARPAATEVGLVIGLKRRRFFGAKWIYTVGDRDGHVTHFLRNSGASLVNWTN